LATVVFVADRPAHGQATPESPTKISPLGVRQQRVEQMVESLQRKFITLTQALQEKEPERAERLKKALEEAKKMLLQQRAGEIAKLLDQAQLDNATDEQKEVLTDIRALLALLLNEKNDKDKNREEFERLEAWKREIEKIVRDERGEKRDSDRIANKDKTLAELAAKIAALEGLIARQQEIVAATQSARSEGIQGLGKIGQEQAAARKQAEAIAAKIAEEAGDKPVAPPPPAEDPAKPADGVKPADNKPANGSGTPMSPMSPSDGSGTPAEGSPARPAEPGEKPLQQAIENEHGAEKNLQEGKGKVAQEEEQTALENLKHALAELKHESSRIAKLPPEEFEKLAGKQDDTANQTARLEEKMQQAADQAKPADGQPGGGQPGGSPGGGKPSPGRQKVQQAQKAMEQASGDLRDQEPGDASRQQDKAIRQLEDALREIEERLAQLREETQIEKLARLEARFREMLARQKAASAETIVFEKKRVAEGELKRSDRLAVGKLAAEERSLAAAAQLALDIILDDGTSVVFPDVVGQVRDDLASVATLIDAKRTDAYTQSQQKEIELTLEELIEALQQAQKQKEGSGGGGGGGGGSEPPLLPGSAELKLLRAAQLRINRRTAAFDTARTPLGELDDLMKQEFANLSQRQAEIGDMTIRILERGQ
jgi:hypothetical protein